MIGLKPRLYFGIVKNSVARYIQIDLKYKFLLFSDVVWLLLDIVAFTFLGGMVDAAVEPNEYYHNFTVDDASDIGLELIVNEQCPEDVDYLTLGLYDSFANEYRGTEEIDRYIYEKGTLKDWEEGNFPEGIIMIDDRDITDFLNFSGDHCTYRDGAFFIPRDNITHGSHFIEIKYWDVDRTGVDEKDRVQKTFSSNFFVGDDFGSFDSPEIYFNIEKFEPNGDIWLNITNGFSSFDTTTIWEGNLKYSLDGENEKNLTTESKNIRLANDKNIIVVKGLKRDDGNVDKGEHTITVKYVDNITNATTNTTFIGKYTFLVPTEEWQNNDQ